MYKKWVLLLFQLLKQVKEKQYALAIKLDKFEAMAGIASSLMKPEPCDEDALSFAGGLL